MTADMKRNMADVWAQAHTSERSSVTEGKAEKMHEIHSVKKIPCRNNCECTTQKLVYFRIALLWKEAD